MKMRLKSFLLPIVTVTIITSCGKLDYSKTKSGLLYKVISTIDSKGPVAKKGNVLKLYFQQKLNDSILQSNYGKMPLYQGIDPNYAGNDYNPSEILTLLHNGDSAITVMYVDSLLVKGKMQQIPPFMKREDRIIVTFKVANLFAHDSLARKDYKTETDRDRPRHQKEMAEQMAVQRKQMLIEREKEQDDWRKSGEIDRELKNMQAYLSAKKINAQKTGKGTFVVIKDPGAGDAINDNDTVSVKYTGRILSTDSVFQSNSYTFPLGQGAVIEGWDEGIKLLKKGGKGTLYIPGFLAYGASGNPPFKPFDALIFEVEILDTKSAPPPTK